MKKGGTDREAIMPCEDGAEDEFLSEVVSGLVAAWAEGEIEGGPGAALAFRARWHDLDYAEGEKIERAVLREWATKRGRNRLLDVGCAFYIPLVHCRQPGVFEVIFFIFIVHVSRLPMSDEEMDKDLARFPSLVSAVGLPPPDETSLRVLDDDLADVPAGRYQFPRRAPLPLPASAQDVVRRLIDEVEDARREAALARLDDLDYKG